MRDGMFRGFLITPGICWRVGKYVITVIKDVALMSFAKIFAYRHVTLAASCFCLEGVRGTNYSIRRGGVRLSNQQ